MQKRKSKRYIMFYKVSWFPMLDIKEYGLMCSRSWLQCLKLGLKHILKGSASFFIIYKARINKEPRKKNKK